MKPRFRHKAAPITEDQLAAFRSAYRLATAKDLRALIGVEENGEENRDKKDSEESGAFCFSEAFDLIAQRVKPRFAPFDDLRAVAAAVMEKVERFLFFVCEIECLMGQYAGHPVNIIQLFARSSLFLFGGQESQAGWNERRQISLQEVEVDVALAAQKVEIGVFSRPKQLVEMEYPGARVIVVIVDVQTVVVEVYRGQLAVEIRIVFAAFVQVAGAEWADIG